MVAVLQHAGVVAEVSVPVPREADEPKDGRRRRFSERLVTGSCAKVIFAGRHGYPGVELWLPEAALEEVSPHPRLRELLSNFERAEVALQQKQHQLELAQKAFATQLKEWMD
ncbi:unnamed protein product [Effrenium voratum]|uniref:Uncharacterized protein n=1 Tax=Effrenium voratum TaxID=2562239 RepID=A0AA36IDU6_9DINO|nr:unnamed protein product [Effrenium voratum]CAJ1429241.1 unnamed protein product [Effrenium voratum]